MWSTTHGFIIGLNYFLRGLEYAVILPSLNLFLLQLGAQPFFIGWVFAAATLTTLLSAPVYGKITDRSQSTKTILIVSNLFQIAGSMLYFAASSPAMVLAGRLVAGLGPGSEASILGMVSRFTAEEKKTAAFSRLFALYQVGAVAGAGSNFFLRELHFNIGPFAVDAYTAPGLFLVILWTTLQLLTIFLFRQPPALNGQTDALCERNNSESAAICEELTVELSKSSRLELILDFCREELIVSLLSVFTVIFVQTSLETFMTPLTLTYFGWNELQNALYLGLCGITIILGYSVLIKLASRLSDCLVLLLATTSLCINSLVFLIFMMVLTRQSQDSEVAASVWLKAMFCICGIWFVFSIPFANTSTIIIFTRAADPQRQDFYQGVRLLVNGVGQILSPIWTASLLSNLSVVSAVNLVLLTFSLTLTIASYKRLEIKENPDLDTSTSTTSNTLAHERTPLISSYNTAT